MNATATTTTTTTTTNEATKTAARRPRLTLYKANARGTGAALSLELHAAHGDTEGCIMATIAQQKTVGSAGSFPIFDWEDAITVKLDFFDLTKMLQVFRGECESIDDGRGLFHRSTSGIRVINITHKVDPWPCYHFTVKHVNSADREDREAFVPITSAEALGLCAAIEDSMSLIVFGA